MKSNAFEIMIMQLASCNVCDFGHKSVFIFLNAVFSSVFQKFFKHSNVFVRFSYKSTLTTHHSRFVSKALNLSCLVLL